MRHRPGPVTPDPLFPLTLPSPYFPLNAGNRRGFYKKGEDILSGRGSGFGGLVFFDDFIDDLTGGLFVA